jgi:hypothetical protein
MSSYETTIETTASTEQVLAVLTDPSAIRDWSPVPFELEDGDGRLEAGRQARVSGNLAGLRVGFDVDVLAADADGLRLTADGPVSLDVAYGLRPLAPGAGSEVTASVSLGRARGLTARVIGKATEALLAAGALDGAAARIANAAEAAAPAAAA